MKAEQDAKPRKVVYDQFVLRFDRVGHRDRIKAEAAKNKRSLNNQILVFIEAGEKAIRAQGDQQ